MTGNRDSFESGMGRGHLRQIPICFRLGLSSPDKEELDTPTELETRPTELPLFLTLRSAAGGGLEPQDAAGQAQNGFHH